VTEEQQSQNRKATQPFGRPFFLAQTSLLAPYRPVEGMRVARASSEPKTPRRKRDGIYEMGYLESFKCMVGPNNLLCWQRDCFVMVVRRFTKNARLFSGLLQ